jgi:hypothetical protein
MVMVAESSQRSVDDGLLLCVVAHPLPKLLKTNIVFGT